MLASKLAIKQNAINLFPKSSHLPLRYYYSKLKGRLEPEIFHLPELIGAGKRAVDIGASRGYYTYALSRLCQQVEVFEPQKWAIDAINAFGKANVRTHNVGLSDRSGFLELNIPLINGEAADALASFRNFSEQCQSIKVPIARLDDYKFEDVSFIKIDVEGYETPVIEGAKETITSQQPTILVEIEQRHLRGETIYSVFNQIQSLNYEGFYLSKGSLIRLDNFAYETHQKPFLEEVNQKGFSESYINNFIFKSRN